MNAFLQWSAAFTGVLAAILVASNISLRVSGAGFIIFTYSSIVWTIFAFSENDNGLAVQSIVLTVINIIGIYRYLVKKPAASAGS